MERVEQGGPSRDPALSRRELFAAAAGAVVAPHAAWAPPAMPPAATQPVFVNDVHSELNRTKVSAVLQPESRDALREVVRHAARDRAQLSICGGRHALGGQQFGTATRLLDTRALNRLLSLDAERGLVEVEAGIQWQRLIAALHDLQAGRARVWSIRQKQTGADALSLGGALSANVHGRGLTMAPFISDVESFTLIDATGNQRTCSRSENVDLFATAIGGYGLFGPIYSVQLRLMPRHKLRRDVAVIATDELIPAFEQRVRAGYEFGDCQFAIDPEHETFLRRGVFSCYKPVPDDTPVPGERRELSASAWAELVRLAHFDKSAAFDRYRRHYEATDGQIYWSDTHQLSLYLPEYHAAVDKLRGGKGSEIIAELYVPRDELVRFLSAARRLLRERKADLIYGTIRLIEQDDESFLAWARQPFACIVMNLHTQHTPAAVADVHETFRQLNQLALGRGGSFYLTYHRAASARQIRAAYPRFAEFLQRKRDHDPGELFTSDWYRHYRAS